MNIAPRTYRMKPRPTAKTPTAGEAWYAERCEEGKRRAEQIKRRMGWGAAAKYPIEAPEVE